MASMIPQVQTNTTQPTTQVGNPTAAKPAEVLPAKKIEPEVTKNNMQLEKSGIGVVEPPKDMFQYSLNGELNKRENDKKEYLKNALPLASSSLSGERRGKSHFFRNLLIAAGTVVGGYFLAKRIKFSSVDKTGITNITEIKKHLKDMIDTTQKHVLQAFHLKKVAVRVIDETADNTKDILNTIRKIAVEARNVEKKTPKIILKLKENAGDAPRIIKEAIDKGEIDSLPDDILKHIEYINLEYLPNDKKATNIIVETISSNFVSGNAANGSRESKFMKFLKDFFGD